MNEIRIDRKEHQKITDGIIAAWNERNERAQIILLHSAFEYLIKKAFDHHLPQLKANSHEARLGNLKRFLLISDQEHQLLASFAKIRNYYAHHFGDVCPEDEEIKDDVRNFLEIGEKIYNTRKSIRQIEENNRQNISMADILPQPGWFSSRKNEIQLVSLFLATSLSILSSAPTMGIQIPDIKTATIRMV